MFVNLAQVRLVLSASHGANTSPCGQPAASGFALLSARRPARASLAEGAGLHSGQRYIGPMAQDFNAVFGLGEEFKELDTVIGELRSELDTVKDRLDSLPAVP